MTIKYVLGTLVQVEDLHKKSRILYLTAFKAQYPDSRTRIQRDYKDRITGELADVTIQLSVDGKDHSDRMDDPIPHPDAPRTDEYLLQYNDTEESNNLKTAFYYNPTSRISIAGDLGLSDIDREEAEKQGFFTE